MLAEAKQARFGKTIIENHINSFGQELVNKNSESVGIVKWRYSGPRDSKNRPFCASLLSMQDKEGFSRAEISVMNNGQTGKGTAFRNRGGYGCRHRWIPVAASAGDPEDDRSPRDAEDSLKKKGVFFSEKPTILIKGASGKITGAMNRVIKRDNAGLFYNRFDGTRQAITMKNGLFLFQSLV